MNLLIKGDELMGKQIEVYDLLISCPGDVEGCVRLLKEKVDNFNRLYGRNNNVVVQTRYWKDDSFPESGGKPQALLNSQIVDDADFAVVIFWTRFGTRTENYGSGVEEEVERMLNSGKQVFLYFMDKPIPPSYLNFGDYSKIKKFRKRYKDRGIYKIADSEENLAESFREDLERYFNKKKQK